jgi:hypothetical protein
MAEKQRTDVEQGLLEKILAEIKQEGTLPESHWQQVAEKRLHKALARQALRDEERPLTDALAKLGVPVTSVWNLYEDQARTAGVVSVLAEHLQKPYSDSILDGIVRALSRAESRDDEIRKILLARFSTIAGATHAKTTMAHVLSRIATADDLNTLLKYVSDRAHGTSRSGLIGGVSRLVGKEAYPLLKSLLRDPDLQNSVIESLGKLGLSDAVSDLQPFLTHRDSYVRQLAKKATKRCERSKAESTGLLPEPATIEGVGEAVHEAWSSSQDIEDVALSLRKIDRLLRLGLPVSSLVDVCEDLDVDQETGFTFDAGKSVHKVTLHIRFYKEDVDTCSIYLFTSSAEFAQLVCERLGRERPH